jgi:hypothetical protein
MYIDQRLTLRKAETVRILERMCQSLELTATQYDTAKGRYEALGAWLAEADDPILHGAVSIYLQGSTALGTTLKPIGQNEHDVDLVAFIARLGAFPPATVRKAIGDCLRANGHYGPLLEEMPRCWRLNYANEFHLDITPSIRNAKCGNGGELVPDKTVKEWKASNPKGYAALFHRRADLQARMRMMKAEGAQDRARADSVEPYPRAGDLKGMLRRTVQVAKRHRDIYFDRADAALAPISVILTTLAAQSYEYCVTRFVYDDELDVVRDIIRHMPAFIETRMDYGRPQWFIWNETTSGENFAEKWNKDPGRAEAFFAWHTRIASDLDRLVDIEGIDRLNTSLSESFGPGPVTKAFDALTKEVSSARRANRLFVAPTVGLTTTAARATTTAVRPNTFFGAP